MAAGGAAADQHAQVGAAQAEGLADLEAMPLASWV